MLTESEILKRLSEGDKLVFKDIYQLYYSDLCKYAYFKFSNNIDVVKDIVQGVFVKLWEKRENIGHIISLKAYLYKSVYNTALNYMEHDNVRKKHQSEMAYRYKNIESEENAGDYESEKLEEVSRYIEEMPEQTKKVFILKYKKGKTYKEIASEMDISPKTVETLIYRGLKSIRTKINKKYSK